jgi:hypothetical protein
MLFFQDEKDKLRQELTDIQRKIQAIYTWMNIHGERLDSLTHPYGAKKDGTPRAKPGRKPKGEKA